MHFKYKPHSLCCSFNIKPHGELHNKYDFFVLNPLCIPVGYLAIVVVALMESSFW